MAKNFYDDENNVTEYIKMADGFDGRELMPILRQHLPDGAHVLELGMGPGKDLALLAEHFKVTGSDRSEVFVNRYLAEHPEADVLVMDASKIDIDRMFDGIYSNKVLMHLPHEAFKQSLAQQSQHLNPGGILLHTLWLGEGEETFSGLLNVYYNADTLAEELPLSLEIVEIQLYAEMEENDSFYVVLRKKSNQ